MGCISAAGPLGLKLRGTRAYPWAASWGSNLKAMIDFTKEYGRY